MIHLAAAAREGVTLSVAVKQVEYPALAHHGVVVQALQSFIEPGRR